MIVRIKKLVPSAVIPRYAMTGDAGMDLVATSMSYDDDGNIVYGVGLAFEIPQGYVGLVFPRSSNAKKDILLSNAVGVVDSGYRGEVKLKYKPSVRYGAYGDVTMSRFGGSLYEVGDRIGQIIIMPYPQIEFEEAEELSQTDRGSGGYGHTGK